MLKFGKKKKIRRQKVKGIFQHHRSAACLQALSRVRWHRWIVSQLFNRAGVSVAVEGEDKAAYLACRPDF